MKWVKIGKKLLFPPVWLVFLLSLCSGIALVAIFVKGWETEIVAYPVYVFSFYALCILTAFLVRVLPNRIKQIEKKVYDDPLGHRYVTDRAFRTRISLFISFAANIFYVALHLFSWYRNRSWWFVVLAVYYVIMAVMRFMLMHYVHNRKIESNTIGEWKRSRICAYTLLLVNLSLSAAVLMILYQSKGFDYPGIMIYVMALYTFYSTIHAIIDIIRFRDFESPIMTTAKIVSLSAALVSMLNLETAMFAQFGGKMPAENQKLMIILTGAGVSVIVVTLSVMLIVRATKEIRRVTHG